MKINAQDLIVGRLATVAAKQALLGVKVDIVNCEKAVVSGSRAFVIQDWLTKSSRGTHRKGPFYDRRPDRFVKRIIRGMLPHRQPKGAAALKRITCHQGVPAGLKIEDFVTIESANVKKLRSTKFVSIKEICARLGGK